MNAKAFKYRRYLKNYYLKNVQNVEQRSKHTERRELMIITLLICVLAISIATFAHSIHKDEIINHKLDLLIADARGNEVIEDSFDAERQVAQELFDERIALLKEELAQEQEARAYESTIADELHPSVTNLPHNKIPYDRVPDDEYAR